MATHVRNHCLSAIRRNKYYGILFDSTPDLAHREQLSQVIRYVDIDFEARTATVKESFIDFIQIHDKDAASLVKTITDKLEVDNIPLNDCCSQCYDNAAVMSGHLSGVQKRILDKNPKALFLNCDNHSLNLACVHAAGQDTAVTNFYGIIEAIYNFFVHSTNRWDQLKDVLNVSLKRESETRWSAREAAVKVVYDNLDVILGLLERLSEGGNTSDTRSGSHQLLQRMLSFDFLVLLHFWTHVLSSVNRVQKRLQDPKMNFKEAAADLDCLQRDFLDRRDKLCEDSIGAGKRQCETWGLKIERRIIRRKRMPGETATDAGLNAENEINRVMKSVMDRLHEEITARFSRLRDLDSRFGFLLDTVNLMSDDSNGNLKEKCIGLSRYYSGDIDGNELYREIIDCQMLLRNRTPTDCPVPSTAIELLKFLISYGEDVFPNLRIALQILLTVSVSIASCERSFSKLKLICTFLRTSMCQTRLSNLALLSIEKDVLNNLNFDEVIDAFAATKARKASF